MKRPLLPILLALAGLLFLWRGPELLANNKPVVARLGGKWYLPAITLPPTLANRDWVGMEQRLAQKPGYVDVSQRGLFSLFGARHGFAWPPLARHPNDIPEELAEPPPTPPGMNGRPLGTDSLGRDLLARLIYAVRLGVVFALVVEVFCWWVGVWVGVMMGYFGGWFDMALSRLIEIIVLFPRLLLLLTLLALLDNPGLLTMGFVFLMVGWIGYQRYVRAEAFKERRATYVEAARALGASHWRILSRHLLPNTTRPTLVLIPFSLASTILALSGLSFLGFGTPAPTADLGAMLDDAAQNMPFAWWLALYPGLTLFLLLLAFNAAGERVRRLMPQRKA